MSKYDELRRLAEMVISLERADGIPATVWKDAYEEYLAAAGPGTALNLIAEVERLAAENETLRKDAARWKLVRSPVGTSSTLAVWHEGKMPVFSGIADRMVDEAMAREASK